MYVALERNDSSYECVRQVCADINYENGSLFYSGKNRRSSFPTVVVRTPCSDIDLGLIAFVAFFFCGFPTGDKNRDGNVNVKSR